MKGCVPWKQNKNHMTPWLLRNINTPTSTRNMQHTVFKGKGNPLYRGLQVVSPNNFLLAHAHSVFLYTNCTDNVLCTCANSGQATCNPQYYSNHCLLLGLADNDANMIMYY